MGPRAMRNNAVLDLASSVELISTLEGLHFGSNREVTSTIEHIQCISTGRRMQSKMNAQVDLLLVHFWCNKANKRPAILLTLPLPNWWTSQIFLGVLYSSVVAKLKIYILELKCPWLQGAEIITINDIATKYFQFCSESSLLAIASVMVGRHLVTGGTRKIINKN